MRHNIAAGRLKHFVQFYNVDPSSTDAHGDPDLSPILLFDARANVKVEGGTQIEEGGTVYTDQRVTALMWYDNRAESSASFLWNGRAYEVLNIQPDEDNRSMIVTGKFTGLITL